MMKTMVLSNSLFEFEVLNSDNVMICGVIEETDYSIIEEFNAKSRQRCEEQAIKDKKAEVVASMSYCC